MELGGSDHKDVVTVDEQRAVGADRREPIAFRLQIGVTGHRDAVGSADLFEGLDVRLGEIFALVENTKQTPVRFAILSALAEGADRFVVEAARRLRTHDEVELHAVLPFEEQEYVRDFPEQRSRDQFADLLASATTRSCVASSEDARAESYERAGRYVVDHSDVVIALWNGRPSAGRGGTAEIVDYARKRGVPVVVVTTTRSGCREGPVDSAPGNRDVGGVPELRPSAYDALQRIDEYNARAPVGDRQKRELDLLTARLRRGLSGSPSYRSYRALADWALPHFMRADSLALKWQRRHSWVVAALYVLAALAVTVVALQSQFFPKHPRVVLAEVVLMVALVAIYHYGARVDMNDRWLGYRSLAEAFRSALFMAATGTPPRSQREPSVVLGHVDDPWYQRAFSEAWARRPNCEPEEQDADQLGRFLRDAWIAEQIRYHREAAARFCRSRVRLTAVVFTLFGTTIVAGVLHTFDVSDVFGAGGSRWLVFFAIAFPGFGAALTGIRDQRRYRVHENRSKRTAERLERLQRELESHSELSSVQRLAAETQALLEAENRDWSGVIEFQNLELVI
jgi:hypothetical protein